MHSCLIFAFRDGFPGAGKGGRRGCGFEGGKKMAGSDAPVGELQANPGPGGKRAGGGKDDEKLGPRKTIK